MQRQVSSIQDLAFLAVGLCGTLVGKVRCLEFLLPNNAPVCDGVGTVFLMFDQSVNAHSQVVKVVYLKAVRMIEMQ